MFWRKKPVESAPAAETLRARKSRPRPRAAARPETQPAAFVEVLWMRPSPAAELPPAFCDETYDDATTA